ncbi:MAG TPA: phospholipase, partial [Caulobacter sp.]|nr:phospholipase [Caulobacter sp.]
GGLAATINELDRRDGQPRRLAPVPVKPLTGVQRFIANWSLGDAISPTDAWRPWGRRRRLKKELRRLTTEPRPELPDHLRE